MCSCVDLITHFDIKDRTCLLEMCELWNYCYWANGSKWLSEAAKRSNAINYVDWALSRPGRLELNRDIWASRRQCFGFWDKVSQTGTVPEKPGRLVSLGEDSWGAEKHGIETGDRDPPQRGGVGEMFANCTTLEWLTESRSPLCWKLLGTQSTLY